MSDAGGFRLDRVRTMIAAPSTASRHRATLAMLLCAVLFFLGTADHVFSFRIQGVTVRIANLLLAGGLVTWLLTRRADSPRDMAALAIAWLPFFALYGLAAVASDTPWLGLLKLSWFAFNFLTAYAWCRLFDPRDLARGYFAAFLVVSAVIVVDFTSGFTRGPQYMIGFGQPNDLTTGQILYRPHAFYYEPSYAASGVGLAWLLALTPMGSVATTLSTMLIGVGLVALTVTMSRTGWLFAVVATVALVLFGKIRPDFASVVSWRKVLVTMVLTALIFAGLLVPEQNRTRFGALLHSLGWQQTLERVCPIVRDHFAFLDLQCLNTEERLRSLGRLRDAVPEHTSEGQRLTSLKDAVASVQARPLLGSGVQRGEHRLIEPTASNMWLEIAVEGGILSVAAFVWGLSFTLHRWRVFRLETRAIAIVLLLYFVVAWQFLQTFPRLDQWLSFWLVLTFAAQKARTSVASEVRQT